MDGGELGNQNTHFVHKLAIFIHAFGSQSLAMMTDHVSNNEKH